MLTEIGPLSSEMLPVVMLPWVLLPLVSCDRIGSARRAAALSALAVLCMGGINAAAVVMALVLPGLWLVTRRWDRAARPARRLVVPSCVAAATLWWIGAAAAARPVQPAVPRLHRVRRRPRPR